jgi:hypothetical protein
MSIKFLSGQDVKGNITVSGNGNFGGDVTVGSVTKTSDTVINSWAGDSNKAGFEARGTSQGTGYFYAGQSTTYGGGFFYNGDGSPAFPATGESADQISFYRKAAGTNEVVFYYGYGSNHVYFRGGIDIGVTANATTDTDKFLVSDSGEVKYRTGAQVLSDIGGAPATGGGYLPLSAGSGFPLTGGLHIPNYIYHNGDTGTNIGYPSVGRFTIATGSATRADFTNAGFSLGDYQTNVSANIILDEDNMGSNSATALVTQQSVKAYVDAHTSGIGGSGTTNFVPLFTAGTTIGNSIMSQATSATENAKRITVSGRMDITGNGGDVNGSTVSLTALSARLGIAIPSTINSGEPEASLDVGKNARVRGSLNVGPTTEQYLFVSTTGDDPVGYVRMGYYGQGTDYALSGDASTSVQYTTGFSNGGKISEDERIMTFKLTRSQIASLASTQKTLIAADSNFNYIVKEAYMYQVNTSPGQAPSFNTGNIVIQYQSSTGGTSRIDNAFELSSTILNQTRGNRKVLFFKPVENAQVGSAFAVPRAAVVLKATSSPSNVGSGTVDYYLRLRVKNIDLNDDIVNNAQLITIT